MAEQAGVGGKQAYDVVQGNPTLSYALHKIKDMLVSLAGERRAESATESYMVTREESNPTVISTTSTVTIGGGVAGDTHLLGLQIHTALAGTCVITGFFDHTGGVAQSYTLPIGSVGEKNFFSCINHAGALTVTCSDAGDDNKVVVFWRPR